MWVIPLRYFMVQFSSEAPPPRKRLWKKCKGEAELLWWMWPVVECVGMAKAVDDGVEFDQTENWISYQKDGGITPSKQCMLLICIMSMYFCYNMISDSKKVNEMWAAALSVLSFLRLQPRPGAILHVPASHLPKTGNNPRDREVTGNVLHFHCPRGESWHHDFWQKFIWQVLKHLQK